MMACSLTTRALRSAGLRLQSGMVSGRPAPSVSSVSTTMAPVSRTPLGGVSHHRSRNLAPQAGLSIARSGRGHGRLGGEARPVSFPPRRLERGYAACNQAPPSFWPASWSHTPQYFPGSADLHVRRDWNWWPLRAWDESKEGIDGRGIYFAGGGIYFFWQLGVAKYLGQRYDLSRTPMSGTSCGALCATLAACGVEPERALESAYQLSLDVDLWNRPLGLAGIWGELILEWMRELLPEEAAEVCRDRVEIFITQLPSLQQTAVADFESKDDLIAVNMASIHVPIFLDWQLTRECRGKQCVDGSLPDVLLRRTDPSISADNDQVVINHTMDENLKLEEFGFLKLREYKEVVHMMDLGYSFAQGLDASGAFIGLPTLASTAE